MPHGLAFLFVPAFAALDRVWGSDLKIYGRSGHSIGTVAAILLAVLAWFVAGWPGAAVPVAWAIYRSIPFFGGSGAPRSATQMASALARHSLAPLFVAVAVSAGRGAFAGVAEILLLFAIYAGVAVILAIFNGEGRGRYNAAVEIIRGAVFGAIFAYALMVAL